MNDVNNLVVAGLLAEVANPNRTACGGCAVGYKRDAALGGPAGILGPCSLCANGFFSVVNPNTVSTIQNGQTHSAKQPYDIPNSCE